MNKKLTKPPVKKAIRVKNSKEARRLLSSVIYQLQKGECSTEQSKAIAYLLGKFIEVDKYIKSEEEIGEKATQYVLATKAVLKTSIDYIISSLMDVLGNRASEFLDIIENKHQEIQKAIHEEFSVLVKQLSQKKINVEKLLITDEKEQFATIRTLAMGLTYEAKTELYNELDKQLK